MAPAEFEATVGDGLLLVDPVDGTSGVILAVSPEGKPRESTPPQHSERCVSVADIDVDGRHYVVWTAGLNRAGSPEARKRVLAALTQRDPNARIVWCDAAVDGQMTLRRLDGPVTQSEAAAAAVFNICCGWDESPLIRILDGDRSYMVHPRFENKTWKLRVDPAT